MIHLRRNRIERASFYRFFQMISSFVPTLLTTLIQPLSASRTQARSNMPGPNDARWQRRFRRLLLFVGTATSFYLVSSYILDRLREARARAIKEKREKDLSATMASRCWIQLM